MNKLKQVVAYIRVSTDMQDLSLEAQQYKLSALCQFHGLILSKVFVDEDTSGRLPLSSRKGGKEMLKYLDENKDIHGVAALRVDRMFRNDIDGLTMADEWAKKGIEFYASDVTGNIVNVKTSTGRLIFSIMLSFAVFESSRISERTKDALSVKKRAKKAYSRPVYGFEMDKDKNMVEFEPEMSNVKFIFSLKLAGYSLAEICRELNRRKIPTKRGKEWYHSTIHYILSNDIYSDIKAQVIAENKPVSIYKPERRLKKQQEEGSNHVNKEAKSIKEVLPKKKDKPVPSTFANLDIKDESLKIRYSEYLAKKQNAQA